MREFIQIVTEASQEPLSREDLVEEVSQVTHDLYGYWVTPNGAIRPVEGLHFQTLSDLGTDLTINEALKRGWIKVTREGEFTAEMYAGCTTDAARHALKSLAEQADSDAYRLNMMWDDTIQCVLELNEGMRACLFEAAGDNRFASLPSFIQSLSLTENWTPNVEPKAIADYAYANIDWSGGDAEEVYYEYRSDCGIEDEDEEVEHDDHFMKWFAQWIDNACGDAEWQIENRIRQNGGKLKVYRAITAPRDWKPDENRHPGVYWSWDHSAAQAHWGSLSRDHIVWVLEATISPSDIDWVATLGQNAIPAYREEKEVRLKPNVPVTLDDYYEMPSGQWRAIWKAA